MIFLSESFCKNIVKERRTPLRLCLFIASVWTACWLSLPLPAAPQDPVDAFRTQVKPILEQSCFPCHTDMAMGGLRIDSREHLLKGGNSGPAVVPGRPAESLLYQAISHTHTRLKMPPEG